MKRAVSVFCAAFLAAGCGWGTLIDDELTGNETVLSESLASSGVLPPSGISYSVIAENAQQSVLITWNSVANAKEYELTVAGDYAATEKVETAQYRFPVELGDEGFTAEVRIKTVNINGVVSSPSAPLPIVIGNDTVYSEFCHEFWGSRGTETSVVLTYAQAKDADSYRIERRRTGADDTAWEVIAARNIPANISDSKYRYTDQTAVAGYRYDYRITPINAAGLLGVSSVAEKVWALPQVRWLRAGQGGEGKYDGNKGIFEVEWEIQTVMLDANDVVAEDAELNSILSKLEFDIRVAASASGLDGLSAPNFTGASWGTNIQMPWLSGFNNNFSDFSAQGTVAGAPVAQTQIYSESEGNLTVYRFYIIVDSDYTPSSDASALAAEDIWNVPVYFQVRPKYGSQYTNMPWSNKASGYVVGPIEAEIWKDGTVSAVSEKANSVSVTWSGMEGSGFQGWYLYMKKEGEAEFSQLEDIGTVSGVSSMEIGGLAAGSYWFGVAGVDGSGNTGIIYESGEVTVAADAVDEPEPVPEPEPEPGTGDGGEGSSEAGGEA